MLKMKMKMTKDIWGCCKESLGCQARPLKVSLLLLEISWVHDMLTYLPMKLVYLNLKYVYISLTSYGYIQRWKHELCLGDNIWEQNILLLHAAKFIFRRSSCVWVDVLVFASIYGLNCFVYWATDRNLIKVRAWLIFTSCACLLNILM